MDYHCTAIIWRDFLGRLTREYWKVNRCGKYRYSRISSSSCPKMYILMENIFFKGIDELKIPTLRKTRNPYNRISSVLSEASEALTYSIPSFF